MKANLTDKQLDDLAGWLDGGVDYWLTGSFSYQRAANTWNETRKLKPLGPFVTKRDIIRAATRARIMFGPSFRWRGAKKGK